MKYVSLKGSAVTVGLTLGLATIPSAAHAQATVPCGDNARLTAAILAGGLIELAKGCTYAFDTRFDTENALPPITGKVTLVGDDTTIMRSNHGLLYRIFMVAQSGDLTLRGIEVSAGHIATVGGGIANEGKLTLEDSAVTGNTADEDGGGVSNEGGTVTIHNSAIARNTALGSAADGGGISNNAAGTVTVEHSKIIGNTTDEDGGGINNQGALEVEDSLISHNIARDDDGGAIGNTGTATLKQTALIGNTAGFDGGAINNGASAKLDVKESTFFGNTAGFDGGGLNNEGLATLTKTKVKGNSAGQNGGGITNEPGAVTTLDRSNVTKNVPNNCFPVGMISGCQS
jgi:hypothetical protein